jgi:hypothetical protein
MGRIHYMWVRPMTLRAPDAQTAPRSYTRRAPRSAACLGCIDRACIACEVLFSDMLLKVVLSAYSRIAAFHHI